MNQDHDEAFKELHRQLEAVDSTQLKSIGSAIRKLEREGAVFKLLEGLESQFDKLDPLAMNAGLKAISALSDQPLGRYFERITRFSETLSKLDFSEMNMPSLEGPAYLGKLDRMGETLAKKLKFPNQVSQALERLDKRLVLVGAYDIDSVTDAEFEADFSRNVSDEIRERLIESDFLPLRIIQRIFREPEQMRAIHPREFEQFVAYVVDKLGFKDVTVTPRSGDGGRDVIAQSCMHGIKVTYFFECKRYKETQKIKPDIMRSLLGVVNARGSDANVGVLVTTSSFTRGAQKMIAREALLDGKDFNDIQTWMDSLIV